MNAILKKISIGCGACLLLLALAVGALWLVGSRLPREHRAASRIELARSPEEVWLYVSDIEGQASWAEGVEDVEKTTTADGRALFVQHSPFGEIPFVVTEDDPPRRFVTDVLENQDGWGGSWSWERSPTAKGCTVTLTESGFDESPIRRFFGEYLLGQHLAIDMMLGSLSRALGEEQKPAHVE